MSTDSHDHATDREHRLDDRNRAHIDLETIEADVAVDPTAPLQQRRRDLFELERHLARLGSRVPPAPDENGDDQEDDEDGDETKYGSQGLADGNPIADGSGLERDRARWERAYFDTLQLTFGSRELLEGSR